MTLEKIVDGARFIGQVTMGTAAVGAALTATVGAIGMGIYEGYTGQKIIGPENSTVLTAAGAGYLTQIIAAFIPSPKDADHRDDDFVLLGAIICPIGPAIGAAMYGAGYGIGKIFQ